MGQQQHFTGERMQCTLTAVCLMLAAVQLAVGQGLRGGTIDPVRPPGSPNTAIFNLSVSVSRGAPACGRQRDIILVNGFFQPTLRANVNDTIVVTLFNDLPASFPQTSSGISLHFHGLSMWDGASWADGTAYVAQCPLQSGQSFTYSFLADEAPGTYFWHDHSAANRADGLQGALLLDLPVRDPPIAQPWTYASEFTLFLTDWWDTEANAMEMALNRPYDADMQTADTGRYMSVPSPNALLINGKGNAADCNSTERLVGARPPFDPPICSVKQFSVPASPSNTGCTHEQVFVQQGSTYLFRLINSGTLSYMTVCFDAHTITIRAADSTPVDDVVLSSGCIDINSGQRYDVALTANARTRRNFWIAVHSQYATGAPSAYAVMRYLGSPMALLPTSGAPLAIMQPWGPADFAQIHTHDGVLGYLDNYDYTDFWTLFQHRGIYASDQLNYQTLATRTVVLNMTAPLMNATGQLRWAMNNIAMPSGPPCAALMQEVQANPNWLAENTVGMDSITSQANASASLLGVASFSQDTRSPLFVSNGQPALVYPAAGMHIVQLAFGDLVDVVIQNLGMSDMNGDYRPDVLRSASIQHPMHLHGHKFWVLGMGPGTYNDTDFAGLNLLNPILRDTSQLLPGSWLYIRFLANNPGIWPLHCHIMWHSFMGQQMYFMESMDRVQPPPQTPPACPNPCRANFAGYSRSWVNATYGGTRFDLPT